MCMPFGRVVKHRRPAEATTSVARHSTPRCLEYPAGGGYEHEQGTTGWGGTRVAPDASSPEAATLRRLERAHRA